MFLFLFLTSYRTIKYHLLEYDFIDVFASQGQYLVSGNGKCIIILHSCEALIGNLSEGNKL